MCIRRFNYGIIKIKISLWDSEAVNNFCKFNLT